MTPERTDRTERDHPAAEPADDDDDDDNGNNICSIDPSSEARTTVDIYFIYLFENFGVHIIQNYTIRYRN